LLLRPWLGCSDVLCASDISGKIAMWNLSLFRKNTTQLVLSEVIPVSFHSLDEPGISCMSFHGSTGVMFTGGLDGSIRYWRLNVDNEAYCLTRPANHQMHSAVEYALTAAPTKHCPPKPVHTAEEARLRTPGGFPLIADDESLCSSATFASDTTSILNYKAEKNLGHVVESLCAMQCSENFLLSGDDSGEMLLWCIHSTANESNAGLSSHHYNYVHGHQDTPYVIVLPLLRFHNNNHNPFKACMSLQQSTARECFVVQGGCGRTPNRISLWKVVMTQESGEGTPSASASEYKTTSNAVVTKVTSRVVLETYADADADAKAKGCGGSAGEKKGGRLAGDEEQEDKADYYATDGEVEVDGEVERDGEEGDEAACEADGDAPEGEAADRSQEKHSFRQKEFECLLSHPRSAFLSNKSSAGHNGAKDAAFEEDEEGPEIPENSYLAHDRHVLQGLRSIGVESVSNTFNFPLTPLMQPNCLHLQLINRAEIKGRASTGNLASRRSYIQKHSGKLESNTSTIVPQFIYVGLGDGPIYKIVLI
jgi:hypothetical protein